MHSNDVKMLKEDTSRGPAQANLIGLWIQMAATSKPQIALPMALPSQEMQNSQPQDRHSDQEGKQSLIFPVA